MKKSYYYAVYRNGHCAPRIFRAYCISDILMHLDNNPTNWTRDRGYINRADTGFESKYQIFKICKELSDSLRSINSLQDLTKVGV